MSRSIRQHLADLSGNSVRDYDFSRLATHFGKAAKARDAWDLRNEEDRERVVALNEPHIDMMRRVVEEAIAKESAEVNGTLPVISKFEALQVAKEATQKSSRDVGLRNLSTHLERRWKDDRQGHLSASDILTLKDHYKRNFPKSAAINVVENFTKAGWLDLPVGHLMDIASQIRNQNDFDYYIKEAGLHTNNPYNKKARNFILALLNGRVAQEDEWDDEDEGDYTVHVIDPDRAGEVIGVFDNYDEAKSFAEEEAMDYQYGTIIEHDGLWEGDRGDWLEYEEVWSRSSRYSNKLNERVANKKRAQEGDKPFRVGVTYEVWDDESLEIGDTDEKGWEVEMEPADLLDIADYVHKYGPFNEASSYPSQPGDWWTNFDADENFETGARTNYSIFVEYDDGSQLDQRDFDIVSKIVSGEMSWSEVDDMMDPDNPEPYQPSDPRQMKLPGVEGKRAQSLISKAVRG